MGIKGLTALLSDLAPKAMTDHDIKTMFGRKVAIDASMSLYQFLIAVRQKDGEMLMNEQGEVTSHLMGTFYRTLRMVEHGIKPAYVFDGKPPDLKSGVLKKRFESREKAKEGEEEAKETGTAEDVDRMNRRQVRVTKEQNAECQRLLKLMGIPVILAPGEAEAQAAELARAGKVYAAGSEDMDTLTFGTPILLRHLTFSEAKKAPISEISLDKALEGLDLTMDQFIDLCILLGCDYVEPIKGVGPKMAVKLMREHGSLGAIVKHLRARHASVKEEEEDGEDEVVEVESEEEAEAVASEDEPEKEEGEGSSPPVKSGSKGKARRVVDSDDDDSDATDREADDFELEVDSDEGEDEKPAAAPSKSAAAKGKGKAKATPKKKTAPKKRTGLLVVPDDWPWEEARQLFLKPNVTKGEDVEVEWTLPDVDGLVQFLVREKGFNEERVRNGAAKLQKMLNAKQQGRLDGFFKVLPKADKPESSMKGAKGAATGAKRKAEPKGKAGPAKKGKK